MKKNNSLLFVYCLIALCSLFSCNKSTNELNYKQNITQIKSEYLPIDSFIGNPYEIICLDTLLIYYDRYDGKLISVYDLKNSRFVGRFIPEGNGPEEVTAPLDILFCSQKDELYTYQRNTAMLNIFNVPDMKMQHTISFTQYMPHKIRKMKDYYIGEAFFDKGHFGVYTPDGEFLQTGAPYPFDGETKDPIEALMLYQGSFCANPENNQFASGSIYCDYLSFYEIKDGEIILLKEYSSNTVKATYSEMLNIHDDCVINYTSAQGTASYCYMLFSGKTYTDNNHRGDGGKYIIVFDWQGNYIKTLETDCKIRTFFVDEINNRIFATALGEDGEFKIVQFKL